MKLRPLFDKTVKSKSAWLMGLSLVRYAVTFLREVINSAIFGAGMVLDAYLIGFNALTVLPGFVENLSYGVFLPVYSRLQAEDPGKAVSFRNGVLSFLLLFSLAFGFGLSLAAPWVARILAPGFPPHETALLAEVLRWSSLPAFLASLYFIFKVLLENQHRFFLPVIAQIVPTLISLALVWVYGNTLGLYALILSLGVFYLLQIIMIAGKSIQTDQARFEFRLLWDETMRSALKLAVPLLVVWFLWNSVTLVDNFFVSQMPSGNTTALNYARRILTMLSVILVGSVYTISVPEISKLVNQNQYPELKSLLVKRMSQSALVLLPFVGLMLCFSEQFVQLAFERGKFDHQATILTAAALRMYMIGIIPFACIRFVYQAFNALGKTYMNTCIFTGIFLGSVILNTLLFHLGITGIALSTSLDFSVAFLVSAVLLFRYLEYQHQSRRLLVPESQFQHPGDEDQESA